MILSVVVPKLQKAQWERIEKEFKGVDYELIVHADPVKALESVSGSFLLFLEEDSAFTEGELLNSLNVFRNNDSYRKLAMVSSAIDFDSIPHSMVLSYLENNKLTNVSGDSEHPVSIGYLYGSIIRTTAYRKANLTHKKDAIYKSVQLSDFLWSNGLRIELNPNSIYFSPVAYTPSTEDTYKIKANAESIKVWKKEFIL